MHARLKKGYKRVPACRAKRLYPFLDVSAFADAFGERRINEQLCCESGGLKNYFEIVLLIRMGYNEVRNGNFEFEGEVYR